MCVGRIEAQAPIEQIFQDQAEALREELRCRPPSAWPDLPRHPRETSVAVLVDSAGVTSFPAGGVVRSSDILIPQYAYFFNPTTEACQPVIIVDTDDNLSFIYIRPSAKTGGAAPMVFFALLGETPPLAPPAPTGGDSASSDP